MNPTPPKGYRLMKPHEKPDSLKGDMLYERDFKGWTFTKQTGGHSVRKSIGVSGYISAYARKKK